MNERIRELAEQAGLRFTQLMSNPMVPVVDGRETDLEKFAELIVRECMDLALSEQKRYAGFTHRNLSECAVTVSNFRLLMKDHFGVENERD
jgi:hypothetical protein